VEVGPVIALQFAILGLGTGAILALLAVGLVVIYRGAGVLNLAHGAYAMFGAYLFWELGHVGIPTIPSILLTVVVTGAAGCLTDQIVLRRLRTASPLARLIATVGMLLLLQASVALIWGVIPKTVSPIMPSSAIKINNVSFPSDRLVLLGIAAVVTAAVALVWRFTRIGWVAEAVSEDQHFARSLGWSPELVSAATWTVGTALAGLAGILIAPITELDTTTMPLLIIPALAAGLVGRFHNFGLAFLGAVVIGVAQSLTERYVSVTGAVDAIPFLIIIGGLVATGSGLPLRGFMSDRLPLVGSGQRNWRVVVPLIAAAAVLVASVTSVDWQNAFSATFAIALIMLSFVVVVGYTGQLSLAQVTIAGLAALIAARLMFNANFPFWAALLGGTLAASAIGSLVAIPALRTRGVNLAIITLGMALTAQSMIFNNQTFVNAGNGSTGIPLPSLTLFGWSIDPVLHSTRYTYVTLAVFVVMAFAVARARRTAVGRMLLAVRDSERAAASNTIDVFAAKVIGFAAGGALAGLGGILLAFQQSVVQFSGYDPMTGISYLSDAVIGGVGFIGGAVFGATLAPNSFGTLITLQLQSFSLYIPLITAVLLLVTLMLNPDGWAAQTQKLLRGAKSPIRRLLAHRPGLSDTAPAAELGRVAPLQLEVRGVEVRYGGLTAVRGLDIDVNPGSVVGLIGPNGAGKTSCIDAVTGFERASSGSVLVGGKNIAGARAHSRARAGVARSFQTLELYPDMTVLENVLTAADRHTLRGLAKSYISGGRTVSPAAVSILDLCGLREVGDRLPEELPHGTQRMLGVARALAVGGSILMVDEPAAALDADESRWFGDVIVDLARERGMGVLVIEHNMSFVMAVCDRVVVMDGGRKISEGSPTAVQNDPVAIAAYLGEEPGQKPAETVPPQTSVGAVRARRQDTAVGGELDR